MLSFHGERGWEHKYFLWDVPSCLLELYNGRLCHVNLLVFSGV